MALLALTMATLCFSTIVGNALVLLALRRDKHLHTVSNVFVASLALADLIVGVGVMPLSSTYLLLGQWIFGRRICILWLVLDYTASTASILNLVLLSLDRFWAITRPLESLHSRTRRRAWFLVTTVWFLSALWLLPIVLWRSQRPTSTEEGRHVCDTDFSDHMIFKVLTAVVNFYMPSLLVLYLNARIFVVIRRRTVKTSSFRPRAYQSLFIVTADREIQHYNGVLVMVMEESISTKKTETTQWQSGKKAARQLGILVGAFLFCWLPYFVFFPLTSLNETVRAITVWLGYCNSAINPFLYPLCNATFRRAFKQLLTRRV